MNRALLLKLTLVPVAVLFGPAMCARGAASCSGYGPLVIGAVDACPPARAALGGAPAFGAIGMACGQSETGGGTGHASWRMPISGPEGRGTVYFSAEQYGGAWSLVSGELHVDDEVIDFVACAPPVEVPTRSFSGEVVSVTGIAPVAVGARCAIALEPHVGATNCRVQVRCANVMLYGGPELGFTRCVGGEGGLVARDGRMSPEDQDPAIELRLGPRTLTLTDSRRAGLYVIEVTLSE